MISLCALVGKQSTGVTNMYAFLIHADAIIDKLNDGIVCIGNELILKRSIVLAFL